LPALVFDARTLAPVVGSLMDIPTAGQAKTGMVGIGMSPSKLGMGEIKLYKACIQTNKIGDFKKAMKFEITRAPYRVSCYPNMVGAHLLVDRPAGSLLKYFS
jgi:hypothetical protein